MLGVSPTLVRALIPKGEPTPTCRPCARSRRPASPGTAALRLAGRARLRRRAHPDREHLRGHRGRGVLPLGDLMAPTKPCSLGFPALGQDMDVFDDDGRSAARRGRRARLQARLAGDDPRDLGRPGALPRHVLAPLPGRVDARRLGVDRRGRLLVPARPLGRHAQHRGQADRPAELESAAGQPSRGRRGRRDRRPARGEGRGAVALLRPPARRRGDAEDDVARAVTDELGKAFSAERIVFVPALPKTRSAKIVRRAVRAKALGAGSGRPLDAREPRGRSRRSRDAV